MTRRTYDSFFPLLSFYSLLLPCCFSFSFFLSSFFSFSSRSFSFPLPSYFPPSLPSPFPFFFPFPRLLLSLFPSLLLSRLFRSFLDNNNSHLDKSTRNFAPPMLNLNPTITHHAHVASFKSSSPLGNDIFAAAATFLGQVRFGNPVGPRTLCPRLSGPVLMW